MPERFPAEFSKDLQSILHFFHRRKVNYLIIGGFAFNVLVKPRTTLDVDFLVLLDAGGLEKLKSQAQKEGFTLDRKWVLWNPMLKGVQIRFRAGGILADVMVPRDEHEWAMYRRKKRKKFGRQVYNFTAPEDLVLQKLKVGRPHDFEDVAILLERMRGRLDLAYTKRWAKRLGISGELNYVLRL